MHPAQTASLSSVSRSRCDDSASVCWPREPLSSGGPAESWSRFLRHSRRPGQATADPLEGIPGARARAGRDPSLVGPLADREPGHGDGLDQRASRGGPRPTACREPGWLERFLERMPRGPRVETPSGGLHLHFAQPAQGAPSINALAPGLDFKAEGGIVLLPPSRRADGSPYRWRGEHLALPPLPPQVRGYLEAAKNTAPRLTRPAPDGAGPHASGPSLEWLRARLPELLRSPLVPGSYQLVRCPAHEDANPSLSVRLWPDGRTFLVCHAGCSFSAVMAALKRAGRPRVPPGYELRQWKRRG
jgi:hypothetical protein